MQPTNKGDCKTEGGQGRPQAGTAQAGSRQVRSQPKGGARPTVACGLAAVGRFVEFLSHT